MATLFRWGYYGWGDTSGEAIAAADAVEASRGLAPPLFVDTRIRRAVRAKGFQGDAFGRRLGAGRHLWMRGLGNLCILEGTAGTRIAEPGRAAELLDLALADEGRRVIFFCSCEWPFDGAAECHRLEVGRLVRAEAERRGVAVAVEEWPGGPPVEAVLDVPPAMARQVGRGRKSIPLGEAMPEARWLGLPWGSVVRLGDVAAISGPARCRSAGWELPVLGVAGDEGLTAGARERAKKRLGQDFEGPARGPTPRPLP